MHPDTSRGTSLVELLVALVLLALATASWLTAFLAASRFDRLAAGRAAADLARRDSVLLSAARPGCRAAAVPGSAIVVLPAAPGRPARTASHRCGR